MRFVGLSLAVVLFAASAVAQDESVMIDDLTTTEVQAAIDAGTTTAIYYVGGTHQNGAAVVLGKHNLLARHLSQRVAEELGNALAYPPNPYAPAGDPIEKTGHMRFAGTVSVSEETFAAVSRDVVRSAIAAGFRHVVMLGDHGGGQDILRSVAAELDTESQSQGARVFYIPVYEEGEGRMREHLATLNVPTDRMTPTDDASEVLAVAGDKVRREQLAEDIARVASPEVGRVLINGKVEVAVASIRKQIGD